MLGRAIYVARLFLRTDAVVHGARRARPVVEGAGAYQVALLCCGEVLEVGARDAHAVEVRADDLLGRAHGDALGVERRLHALHVQELVEVTAAALRRWRFRHVPGPLAVLVAVEHWGARLALGVVSRYVVAHIRLRSLQAFLRLSDLNAARDGPLLVMHLLRAPQLALGRAYLPLEVTLLLRHLVDLVGRQAARVLRVGLVRPRRAVAVRPERMPAVRTEQTVDRSVVGRAVEVGVEGAVLHAQVPVQRVHAALPRRMARACVLVA